MVTKFVMQLWVPGTSVLKGLVQSYYHYNGLRCVHKQIPTNHTFHIYSPLCMYILVHKQHLVSFPDSQESHWGSGNETRTTLWWANMYRECKGTITTMVFAAYTHKQISTNHTLHTCSPLFHNATKKCASTERGTMHVYTTPQHEDLIWLHQERYANNPHTVPLSIHACSSQCCSSLVLRPSVRLLRVWEWD